MIKFIRGFFPLCQKNESRAKRSDVSYDLK